MKLDLDAILDAFPKRVPIFPLAEVILFPGALLPLHIFEPRYRRMLADTLEGDRLIAMALLKQCDRKEYQTKPPFHETVCIGQVIHHEGLPDGRANIALLGLSAGRAIRIDDDKPYRTAEVELLLDRADADTDQDAKIQRAYARAVPGGQDLQRLKDQLEEFLLPDHIPSALINTCAVTAPLFPMDKLELLEERSLARRLDRLLELLERPWQWN
ncbi:MAG: LON peptidase substrate-binding domain-containing protein [Planctomycetota bacterium]